MKTRFLAVLALAGCASPSLTPGEREALSPLGARAGAFEDAVGEYGLEGADRDAYFWLLRRAAERCVVGAQDRTGPDIRKVTPEALGLRIVQARKAQEWPWAPRDEDAWRRGVLMYRVAAEEITNWYDAFTRDAAVEKRLRELAGGWRADPDGTLRRVVHFLNADVLGARVAHKPRKPPDLSPEECLREGGGRATDLAIAAVSLMRAWGVPAVLVRTPCLVGASAGDAWVHVLGTDIHVRPADRSEIGEAYFRYRRGDPAVAKAWACDTPGDTGRLRLWKGALPFRAAYAFVLQPARDVTRDVTGASRVQVPGLPEPSFLCVWCAPGWLEVAPGATRGEATDFGACGDANVLYLVTSISEDGRQTVQGDPFVLRPDSTRLDLKPGPEIAWTPEGHEGHELRAWIAGRFELVRPPEKKGDPWTVRSGALHVWWTPGPENNHLGKPASRPFVLDATGKLESF